MAIPDRIYAQYATMPKAVAWYNITPTIALQIQTASEQVRATYDIDSQSGVQLDIIGVILNASRGVQTDDEYKQFLRAAIVRNNSDATIDDIVAGMTFIVDSDVTFTITDHEDMSFSIEVLGTLTAFEKDLLLNSGILSKPQGVRIRGILELDNLTPVGGIDTSQCGRIESQCRGFITS